MSCTTIYKIGKNVEEVAEIQNAHRGAMYVWHETARKYFGLQSFPMFDEKMMSKVWNAHVDKNVSDHDAIVLASTMDKAVVDKDSIQDLIKAYEAYGAENENSSFLEQAEALKTVTLGDGEFIAWHQTSCGDFWVDLEWNEDEEDYDRYDPNAGDIHFDAVKSLNLGEKKEA